MFSALKTAATERALDVLDAFLRVRCRARIHPRRSGRRIRATRRARRAAAPRRVAVDAPGNHQRDARLIDHQRIGFIDEREVKRTVHQIGSLHRQQVAQVIEAGLFRGDVGDVRVIGRAPVGRRHSLLNAADRQSEQAIDRTHPLGIARPDSR